MARLSSADPIIRVSNGERTFSNTKRLSRSTVRKKLVELERGILAKSRDAWRWEVDLDSLTIEWDAQEICVVHVTVRSTFYLCGIWWSLWNSYRHRISQTARSMMFFVLALSSSDVPLEASRLLIPMHVSLLHLRDRLSSQASSITGTGSRRGSRLHWPARAIASRASSRRE